MSASPSHGRRRALIVEMYESFFQTTFPQELVSRLPDMRMTPAEVGQCLFKHFGSPDPAAMCRCLCAAAESAHTESDRRRRLSARRQEQVAEKEARSFSDALLDRTMPAEDPQKPLMQTSKVHNAEGVCVTADVIEEALAYDQYPRPDLIAEAEKLNKHNFGKDVQGTRGSLSLCAVHREPDNQHNQYLESVRNNLPESFVECDNSSELATIVDAHVPLLSQTFQN